MKKMAPGKNGRVLGISYYHKHFRYSRCLRHLRLMKTTLTTTLFPWHSDVIEWITHFFFPFFYPDDEVICDGGDGSRWKYANAKEGWIAWPLAVDWDKVPDTPTGGGDKGAAPPPTQIWSWLMMWHFIPRLTLRSYGPLIK